MEETVRMVQSAAQAGVEITAELLKILAPALAKGGMKLLGAGGKLIGYGIDKISDAQAEGTVSRKHLFAEAAKVKTEVMCTDSYPQDVADRLVEKAKEYHIPVSLNGEGASRSISYLERDKDVLAQIMQEWQQERLAPKAGQQGIKSFSVSELNVDAVKSHLEQNGVECWFTQSKSGEIHCNFAAGNEEKVNVLMTDFKNLRSDIEEKCTITMADIPESESMAAIRSQIEELQGSLENAEERGKFYAELSADKSVKFPEYSEKNMERVYDQMPDATRVAGKAFWEEQGYSLAENAKGIEIIAPQTDENGNPVLDENGEQTFTTVTVYDISETNAYEQSVGKKISELERDYDAERVKAFKSADNKTITVSDNEKGVEITVTDDLRKSDVMTVLQEELGYTSVQAELAANKLADELELGENYFTTPTQIDNLEKMQVNIRYSSDDVSIRDVSFSALKLYDGENVQLNVTNGDSSILIEPSELSDSELISVFKEQLGLTDRQAEMALSKTRKIDSQIQSKLRETLYSHDGGQRSVNIERTSQSSFIVKAEGVTKSYDFRQINLEEKIASDFKIPAENAHRVVQKAQGQSTIQNKLRDNAEKKRRAAKAKNDPLKSRKTETNSKKVKR